jgi:DNA-binding PadR family transcriptional regulator
MRTYVSLSTDEKELLESWEEIYKRGHLTFWVLLSLWRQPLEYSQIVEQIEQLSGGTCMVTEQSLYRALRRFDDAGMIMMMNGKDKRSKLYHLSLTGRLVLQQFTSRTIQPFYAPDMQSLVKEILQ